VNGLGCRQTEAQWSFDYLYDHSHQQEVSGGTVTTTARVIDGAVLIAAKLHSGRETDLRDVLSVAEEIDLKAVTPICVEGTTMHCGSSLSADWKSWRATNSSTDIGVSSGLQVFQKRQSVLCKSFCYHRLTSLAKYRRMHRRGHDRSCNR